MKSTSLAALDGSLGSYKIEKTPRHHSKCNAHSHFSGGGEGMLISWSDDLLDTTQGLDILGVRGIDQGVELGLVNGITTISQRARYFTILPWALGQFLTENAAEGFDWDGLNTFLRRIEFLTLAASRLDSELNGTDASGALGANVHQERLASLMGGETVTYPENIGGAILGTYYAPCRAIGLLLDGDETVPYHLSPRGREIWEFRKERIESSSAISSILKKENITRAEAETTIPEFSLGALANSAGEAQLLYDALVTPWDPDNEADKHRVLKAYESFNGTITWTNEMLTLGSDNAIGLIVRNFNNCTQQALSSQVAYRWAEYEYRRRCHFALELILSALTNSLSEFEEATISQIVSSWVSNLDPTPMLHDVWPRADDARQLKARDAITSIPKSLYSGAPVPTTDLRNLPIPEQAYAAIAILSATAEQTSKVRRDGYFEQKSVSPGERAVNIIEGAGDEPFSNLMENLVELTALSHLQTTLRKMGAGQKCSLRFFPDGPLLRPTGTSMSPGHSNDRLTNVLRILSDIGRLKKDNGKFASPAGGAI